MRNLLHFYWNCLVRASSGLLGAVGNFGTLFAIALAVITSIHPKWIDNPDWLSKINAVGGWIVPIGILAFLGLLRLILAPYWLYSEVRSRLDTYELSPLSIKFIEPLRKGLITVKITNRGHGEERVSTAYLVFINGEGKEGIFRKIKEVRSNIVLPHAMPPRSSVEVVFMVSYGAFVSWGVKSMYAVAQLEDERESKTVIHSISFPVEWQKLADEQGNVIERKKRISLFVGQYITHQLTASVYGVNKIDLMQQAGIQKLHDHTELEEAVKMLDERGYDLFSQEELNSDIIRFFKTLNENQIDVTTSRALEAFEAWVQNPIVTEPRQSLSQQ